MKRPKLLFFVSALVFAVGAATFLAGRDGSAASPGDDAPATPAGSASASSSTAATVPTTPEGPPPKPFGTVSGSEPHTKATLLRLRRTGPKVVSVTLSLALERRAKSEWMPNIDPPDRYYTAGGIVLVDEVNAREHFVLENSDGRCLCSTDLGFVQPGDSIVVSAKFPAPPADVPYASIQVPGFPSFDRVPIEP